MPNREKVMQWLETCASGCEEGCPYEYENLVYRMECKADLMRDALSMLKEQEWISVKDRLPNCNGCYLVWRPNFYTDKGMPSICYFDGSNTWHDSYGVDFTRLLNPEDVTHWMELPVKPTEG